MKVLLTHRFFWPDTAPYALMLRAIGDALAEAGHEVHIFSSVASYRKSTAHSPKRQRLGALNVRRTWIFADEKSNPLKRLANVVIFCMALFIHVIRLRPDVVTASTFPPVVAAWCASLAARLIGARFLYHLQDIHPEVSQISGGRLGRGVAFMFLRWLDNQTLRRADAIVTLSEDMAETLRARGLGVLPLYVINNPSLDFFEASEEPPADLRKPPGKQRIIFAGNIGRFQNLPLLAEGVAELFEEYPDLELFFLGDGTALPELKYQWGQHAQVKFGPFLPFAQAKELISEADIGLVSLQEGLYRVAYPSKIASYLAQGVPVMAVIEEQSDMARQIKNERLGAIAAKPEPHFIKEALAGMLQDRHDPSEAIAAWVAREADAKAILPRWTSLFEGLSVGQ